MATVVGCRSNFEIDDLVAGHEQLAIAAPQLGGLVEETLMETIGASRA